MSIRTSDTMCVRFGLFNYLIIMSAGGTKNNLFCFLSSILISSSVFSQTTGELLKMLDTVREDTTKVQLYNDLFLKYEYSDTTKAKDYLYKALKLASDIDYKKGMAETYRYIGFLMEDQGNFHGAYSNYQTMLQIAIEIDDKLTIATAYNNIGNVYIHQGNYIKALEYYKNSYNLAIELNNKILLSKTVNNLGACYYNLNKYNPAVEYYTRAIVLANELNNVSTLAIALDNIGVIYQRKKEYDKALESHQKSLELRKKLNDKAGIASCYQNMGIVNAAKGENNPSDMETALENYNKALSIYSELGLKEQTSNCYYNIAILHLKQKNISKALEMADKSHKINLESGGVDDLRNTYSMLSDCYRDNGMYKEAYEYYVGYKKMFDSLINVENIKMLTQLEMQHEFDKKESEREFRQKQKDLQKEEELRLQKTTRNSLIIGIILLAAIIIIILRSYRIRQKDNALLAKQRDEIQFINTQITNSIKYAQRIQEAILPPEELITQYFPESFVLYRPKAIVSGDFYWANMVGEHILFAVVDCTGHGVPGAFISILGSGGLNRAINEFKLRKPSDILNKLNDIVNTSLHQSYSDSTIRDGMDIALCSIDYNNLVLEYSGAFCPLYIIRGQKLIEIKGDKQPVGQFVEEKFQSFTNHTVQMQINDMIYIFSDGYPDQFGGQTEEIREKGGVKFKLKPFADLLKSIAEKPINIQKDILEQTLSNWQGNLDQIDDICVMGIRL
ncbi:MAG: tetratricopeptide repeat protein [Bacteroidia bacterium]|nr:tetratricopeptide repeat protein [Bacteroidia bacterium]